jgi:APA family basic amino acid/polyamine antiporter
MIVSLLAAVNANQLIASRVPLAMARDRLLPWAATRVNEGGTPTTALFAGTGVMLLLIATNSFDTILALLAFFFVANYALSFASVFVLRRREPLTPRPFRAIGYPWTTGIALAGSIAFLAASVVGDPGGSVRSLLLLAASVPVFLLVRGRGSSE